MTKMQETPFTSNFVIQCLMMEIDSLKAQLETLQKRVDSIVATHFEDQAREQEYWSQREEATL